MQFLSVVVGWILWRATGNIWLAAILAVVLFPLVGPILKGFFQLIVALFYGLYYIIVYPFTRVQPLEIVREENQPQGQTAGLRALVRYRARAVTPEQPDAAHIASALLEDALGDPERPRSVRLLVDYLAQYVQENRLPVQVTACRVTDGSVNQSKSLIAWHRQIGWRGFHAKENETVFAYKATAKLADGKPGAAELGEVTPLFGPGIAVPEALRAEIQAAKEAEKKAAEEAAKAASAAAATTSPAVNPADTSPDGPLLPIDKPAPKPGQITCPACGLVQYPPVDSVCKSCGGSVKGVSA